MKSSYKTSCKHILKYIIENKFQRRILKKFIVEGHGTGFLVSSSKYSRNSFRFIIDNYTPDAPANQDKIKDFSPRGKDIGILTKRGILTKIEQVWPPLIIPYTYVSRYYYRRNRDIAIPYMKFDFCRRLTPIGKTVAILYTVLEDIKIHRFINNYMEHGVMI